MSLSIDGGSCLAIRLRHHGDRDGDQREDASSWDQLPELAQRVKNAMAWRLQLEIFRDLGLVPTDNVTLP
ncbi:MAG: hypothetical protein JO262_02515 [Solirubrobacterales bacterium]|nr:hypothetical protein [Solirubrobacterales bacterium]